MAIRTTAFFCAVTLLLAAAEVTGKWKVDAQSSTGTQYKLDLLLKEEGGKLRGTLTTDQGEVVELQETKLEGDDLTFKLYVDPGAYSIKLKVSGNSMKGGYTGPSGETGTVAATR